MNHHLGAAAALAATVAAQPSLAHAQSDAETRPPSAMGFHAGRYASEVAASLVLGAGAGYLTYRIACDDEPCAGGVASGAGVSVVLTPLAAWTTGTLMGGDGGLGYSYLGSTLALGAGALGAFAVHAFDTAATAALIGGFLLMPFTSSLGYELSSQASEPAPRTSRSPGSHGPRLIGYAATPLLARDGRLLGVGVHLAFGL